MKQQIRSAGLLFLTAVIWGVAFVAQSVGMDYIRPFTFNGVRCVLGGMVLLPYLYLFKKFQRDQRKEKENRKQLLLGGICCGVCLCMASNLQQIALQSAAVGKAGFLTACYIVIVPILGLFLKKKCSPYIWSSVGLAAGGLYLLCVKDTFFLETADYLLLLSAFLFAVHILVIDYFSPLVNGVKMACIQFFVCSFFSLIAAVIWEKP